jgi:protein-tyrosine-phosphatase
MTDPTKQSTQTKLGTLSDLFSQRAIQCMSDMFGHKCEIHMPWEVVEQLQAQFDRILTMGSSNAEYTAITCAGIQYDSMNAFAGQENVSNEMAADILGEITNTYNALLVDSEKFRNTFGVLIQGVPVLYTDGHSFLPFIWGIQGYLYLGEHWMYMGFSIRSLPTLEKKAQGNPFRFGSQKQE